MARVEKGKTYIGIVEDNNDPKKLGRVKVRVLDVFDDTPIEDIPFANPWKDLGGNEFNIPDVSKIVTVVFESGNENSPEFISSDHYNINLEKKLSELSKGDYLSMKSLIFDHKTQIYVNDSEGLKLDHKFNMLNIKDKSIDIGLKDNFSRINIGSADSTQRSILGDNFLSWFDSFVDILMGSGGGPFIDSSSVPVVLTPALLSNLNIYKSLKDPKFLSKNVYIVDNDSVTKLDRISDGQKGDYWQSTIVENKLTTKEDIDFQPTDGSTETDFDSNNESDSKESKDIKVLIEIMNSKNYVLYEDVNRINIISVRNQCISPGDKYSNQFVDNLYLLFKREDGKWFLKKYIFSTVPGLKFKITESWLDEKRLTNVDPWSSKKGDDIFMKEYASISESDNFKGGLPILAPSQYIDMYYIKDKSMLPITGSTQLVYRDNDMKNLDTFIPNASPEVILSNIGIKVGSKGGISVGSWSEGDQLFSSIYSLDDFFKYCELHKSLYGNKFTYTLATKKDWDKAYKKIL